MSYEYIEKNYNRLLEEIDTAAKGREVTLVSVTKGGTDEELLALASLGVGDIGENRPGELKRRGELLRAHGFTPRLHEIGQLQRNKVKYVIDCASLIHSVDSVALGREISRLASVRGIVMPVLIEVNSACEEQKGGVLPDGAEALLCELSTLPSISVRGVMTMGPRVCSPEDIRPYFRRTRELFDRLHDRYHFKDGGILSMGMSDSFTVAIEEGATLVRVGSRLFEK